VLESRLFAVDLSQFLIFNQLSMLKRSRDGAASVSLLRPFMPELDTLRGIAVLGVILLHAFSWPYSGLSFGTWGTLLVRVTRPGWIGVNLFFVLSGFLITGILLDSRDRPEFYRGFYLRRALRILPAYYLLLVLLLLLRTASFAFVGLSFIYLANVTNFFGVACGYGPLWSLAVEEHFYLLWPAAVRKLTPRRFAVFAASIVLLTPILRALAFSLNWKDGLDWYTWFVTDGLALGALLAILLRTSIPRAKVRRLCLALLGSSLLAGVAGAPLGLDTRNRLLGAALQLSVINAFFAGVVLLFLLVGSGPVPRLVNFKPLRFFGYISYGLYLDHLLVFRMYDRICGSYWPSLLPSSGHFEKVILRFAVGGTAAVVAACLSRRFFEEYFLRLKNSLLAEPAVTQSMPASFPAASPQNASQVVEPSPVQPTWVA